MSGKTWGDSGKRTVVNTKEILVPTPAPTNDPETTDIDSLLHCGLRNISRLMNIVSKEASMGILQRETVQNLKDLMFMLSDLKKKESDLLDSLSDEELERISSRK